MIRSVLRVLAVIAVLGGLALSVAPAGAESTTSTLNPVGQVPAGSAAPTTTTTTVAALSGPTLTLDQTSVDPGQPVTVIFTGWQGRLVTLSVCGNLAKRGSTDCNMPASQGVRLYHVDDSPLTSFVISTPPGTCPCVIRASSDSGETAYAPIEIRGVALGPVVDPFSEEPPLALAVDATPAPDGIFDTIKSWLGGPTAYDVTVKVTNQATEPFSNVAVHGAVGRDSETDLDGFDLVPGPMAAGQTWTGTAHVTVPAPVVGQFDWHTIASGAGPVTETSSTTRAVPWLLLLLVLALVGDLVAVVVRWVQRRRARHVAGDDPADPASGPVGPPPQPSDPATSEPAPAAMAGSSA
jgi:hypothetical protein